MIKPHIEYHKDGTIRAKGKLKDGKRDGYWKFYRADGTKLKTGFYTYGELTKDWMMYDKKGKLIKPLLKDK